MGPLETSSFGAGVMHVPKTAEVVAARIRRQIVRGELEDGDMLPQENELTALYGVSRPTLREAFRILESERLIVVRRGARGGARVRAPDGLAAAFQTGLLLQYHGVTIEDVHEARRVLELEATASLARSRTAADVRELQANVDHANDLLSDGSAGALDALPAIGKEFHEVLMRLSARRTLTIFHAQLGLIIERSGRSYAETLLDPDTRRRSALAATKAHQRLIHLIEDRDAAGADQLWRKHHTEVTRRVVQTGPVSGAVVDLLSE
jgi:DNA-binding FadR family transcriptional regulator